MSVKSAERVLEIFNLLAENPMGLTCKEISQKLGYAASSTFELLKTLEENNYLLVNENKKYFLGMMLIRLGNIVSENLDLKKIIKPHLLEIMNTFLETTFLGMITENNIIYIDKVQSNQTVSTNANIGSIKPAYCTGLGKIILANMKEDKLNQLLNTIKFEKYKKKGYAIDNEEIEEGLWCLAVPIYDSSFEVKMAISISGPKERMLSKKEKIKEFMLKKSKEISKLLV